VRLAVDDADALAGERGLAGARDAGEARADDEEVELHGRQLAAGMCERLEASAKRM